MEADKPIIVVKKKGGHGGHHGGAWKIAYADFVTAMMAFFLVMWLVNSASTPTKERIASYFRRPGLFEQGSGTPIETGGSGILDDAYVPSFPEERQDESGESQTPMKRHFEKGPYPSTIGDLGKNEEHKPLVLLLPTPQGTPAEVPETLPSVIPAYPTPEEDEADTEAEVKAKMEKAAEEIRQAVQSSPELQQIIGTVDVITDADSLIIEIMDTDKTSMFASGSAYIREEARLAFAKLADALKNVKNQIEIVGHTDAHPFSSRASGYSNWELSVDRANAARRLLIGDGLDPSRIKGVLGKAETMPKKPDNPFDASNRRITLRMKFDLPKRVEPAATPVIQHLDMKEDPAAGAKLKQSSDEISKNLPDPSLQILDRIHSLTPKDILNASKPKKENTPPPTALSPSFEWKDPKFTGEK